MCGSSCARAATPGKLAAAIEAYYFSITRIVGRAALSQLAARRTVGVWMRAHVFGACAARQFPTHVHPASHMQNHSAPTPLQTPPGCKSQPCASSKHGDTVGAGVGAAVGSGVGAGVHTGVGHGVAQLPPREGDAAAKPAAAAAAKRAAVGAEARAVGGAAEAGRSRRAGAGAAGAKICKP